MYSKNMKEQRRMIASSIKAYNAAFKTMAAFVDMPDDESPFHQLNDQLLIQVARTLGYDYHTMEEPLKTLFLGDLVDNLFWAEWQADDTTTAFLQGKMVAYKELSGHYARTFEPKPKQDYAPIPQRTIVIDNWLRLYINEFSVIETITKIRDFKLSDEAFFWYDYLPKVCKDYDIAEDTLKFAIWQVNLQPDYD